MELWWQKFQRMRRARGWSLAVAADAFVAASELHTPAQVENVRRSLIRWEHGGVSMPNEATRRAIARMFDLPVSDFWPDRPFADVVVPERLAPDAFAELIEALRMPKVGAAHLEQAEAEVERLCTAYASIDAKELIIEVDAWAAELAGLVSDGRVNLAGHQQVLRLSGWLALLRSCLMWDQGYEAASRQARVLVDGIAHDLGDPVMAAWGWEIQSWTALTQGDMPQAIAAADAGIAHAPAAPVAAQLWSQKAKAFSRMADKHKTEIALEQVRHVLDHNEPPANVRNHFAVDPTKASFYAMDAYRVLRDDALADAMAETVIRTSRAWDGRVISPMRLAEAQLTRAIVLARNADINGAVSMAEEAISYDRRSSPGLLLVTNELAAEVRRQQPQTAIAFARRVRELTGSPS